MQENQIICGAMPEATKVFPDGHFNCCISSPPYWALRDYGVDGQLGLEPTFEEYIDKLCTIYDEVKRVLRKDGTCWVNLGDTYSQGDNPSNRTGLSTSIIKPKGNVNFNINIKQSIQQKSLCLIPQRFAIEMVNRGWILRNVIIWHKPNPMPSSAKDRFTVDFEYVYFFVKSKKYWFEPQYEPFLTESNAERPRMGQGQNTKYNQKRKGQTWAERKEVGEPMRHGLDGAAACKSGNYASPLGRNKRTVWTIPTQPYPEAHFATFPEKLVEPMIKAGCPEFVCTKCGKAREKIIEATGGTIGQDWNQHNIEHPEGRDPDKTQKVISAASNGTYKKTFKGYTDCGCNADWRPGIVLDCFCRVGNLFTGSCKTA